MPKSTTPSTHPSLNLNPLGGGTSTHPNVLKRNQACHQCRKRKLKCDAKRPCSTCVRSHSNALAHPVAGVEVPPQPECTFDDAPPSSPAPPDAPKTRYEKLENRINELEALLRQNDESGSSTTEKSHKIPGQTYILPTSKFRNDLIDRFSGSLLPQTDPATSNSSFTNGGLNPEVSFLSQPPQNPSLSPLQDAFITSVPTPPQDSDATASSSDSGLLDLLWSSWPAGLPTPTLLRHLVEVFFAFHPHAGRLLHGPTFLASLSLPPDHSDFPFKGLLHSICAVGSIYTAAIPPPPMPNLNDSAADDVFQMKYRAKYPRPDSFGEDQARLARRSTEEATTLGEHLFDALRSNVVLMWYYHMNARWVDVFMGTARSLRSCVPMGLNTCSPFQSISRVLRAPSILSPAKNALEDETRRNVFWLAYAHDRFQSCANGWAMNLDDQDVSQMLPVRVEYFEQGALVPPNERQWAHSPDVLLVHPLMQTDSFILYIKTALLLSRVKTFNLRFRSKHFARDPDNIVPTPAPGVNKPIDPRKTPAFIAVDEAIQSFKASIPKSFRNPITDNVVDPHLYATLLAPYLGEILLHDPHAHVESAGCTSAMRLLESCRAILDLLYALYSTSYDITLVDTFCMFCWFMTGKALVRFLQVAQKAQDEERIMTIRTELEFLRLALEKVGNRFPLAYRYSKMLDDVITSTCGPDMLSISPFSSSSTPITSFSTLSPMATAEMNSSGFCPDTASNVPPVPDMRQRGGISTDAYQMEQDSLENLWGEPLTDGLASEVPGGSLGQIMGQHQRPLSLFPY